MSAATLESRKPDVRRIGLNPDFWYPLADGTGLPRGSLTRVQFAGEPIALMRGASGQVYAFEDRCPHRQFPLHRGVVDGDELRCSYHGWRFGGDGRCLEVPSLRRAPAGLRAHRYPAREAYGMIFVFPGDAARAERVPLPRVPSFDLSRINPVYYSREVRCHYSFMQENLMDMTHQFLHRRLMGSIEAEICDVREGESSVEVEYRFTQRREKIRLGGEILLGRRDREGADDSIARVTVRCEYPYQTLEVRRPGRSEPSFHMWATHWPIDRSQRVTHTRGMLMVPRMRIPGLFALLRPVIRRFTEAIFAEDRDAVEAEQRAYDEQGGDWNREVCPVIFRLQDLMRRAGVAPRADAATEGRA